MSFLKLYSSLLERYVFREGEWSRRDEAVDDKKESRKSLKLGYIKIYEEMFWKLSSTNTLKEINKFICWRRGGDKGESYRTRPSCYIFFEFCVQIVYCYNVDSGESSGSDSLLWCECVNLTLHTGTGEYLATVQCLHQSTKNF